MTRVRWTGDGDREVMVSVEADDGSTRVEQVDATRLEWVDVPVDTARSLAKQDGWELESVKKAQRTRAANEAADSGEATTEGEG